MPNDAAVQEPKRVTVAEKDWDETTKEVTVKFSDGQVLVAGLGDIPEAMVVMLALHGLSQKLGDSYAGVKGNVAQAFANATEVFNNLKSGVWGAAGGGGGPRLMDLAEAIAALKNIEVAKALEAVSAATDEQRKAWRAHPTIKTKIAEIALTKAQAAAANAGALELNI